MKVILTQDVINLGEEGDVVVVKDGYARNYLLPTGGAVRFNKTNMAIVKSRSNAIEQRKEEKRKASATLAERLNDLTLNLVVSAGDSGKLFGSVTSLMIQEALASEGIEIERKKIEISSQMIKMVGSYNVRVHLYENDFATVKLVVESESVIKMREMEAKRAEEVAAREAAKTARIAEQAASKAAAEAEVEAEVSEESAPVTE